MAALNIKQFTSFDIAYHNRMIYKLDVSFLVSIDVQSAYENKLFCHIILNIVQKKIN